MKSDGVENFNFIIEGGLDEKIGVSCGKDQFLIHPVLGRLSAALKIEIWPYKLASKANASFHSQPFLNLTV